MGINQSLSKDLDPNTGDLHGDYQRTLDALRVTQLIDENDNWIGNKTVLVQTGDITDRGYVLK